jgi:hypothetical protein
MKRLILLVCLLCGLSAKAQIEEAVGIQTENPQGVLHIDGASTTATVNPSEGIISPVQASDDVVIDADGRLGVGRLEPAAKVDISASAPGGALRIKDGTEGSRKALASDANGLATWAAVPGSWWYAALYDSPYVGNQNSATNTTHPIINYTSSQISPTGGGGVNPAAGTITVPFTGRYRITFSMHYNARVSPPYWARTILYVAHSGSSVKTSRWTPSVWGATAGLGTLPTFSAVLALDANDVLSLTLDASQSYSAHYGMSFVFAVEFIQ